MVQPIDLNAIQLLTTTEREVLIANTMLTIEANTLLVAALRSVIPVNGQREVGETRLSYFVRTGMQDWQDRQDRKD